VVCSALVLHESLSVNETVGCVVMFAAIVLSQFSEPLQAKLMKKKKVRV